MVVRDSFYNNVLVCFFKLINHVRLNDRFDAFHGFTVLLEVIVLLPPPGRFRTEFEWCRQKIKAAAKMMPAMTVNGGAPALSSAAPTIRDAPQKYFHFISRSP